ncbi:MAG: histidine ammonia-lyase [Alphaproteobacteria bacterium]
MPTRFVLRPGGLSLAELRRLERSGAEVVLDDSCRGGIEAAAGLIERLVEEDRRVYGINTGVGSLARTAVAVGQAKELQRRLVLSHCVGTGPLLRDRVVRRILLLKANALALGRSGVRPVLVEALLTLLNAGVLPCIPAKGSAGASGDLAPLAHLAAALIGAGEVRVNGAIMPAADGLERTGLIPIELAPKEGLALLNGTQVSTALAIDGLFAAEDVFAAAVAAGALSVDAALASDEPFDPRLHEARGQPGQAEVAAVYGGLLVGSEIRTSHLECDRVQDPYSLRCQPQVMGACLDLVRFAAGVLGREVNAVSDNPLVFAESGDVLSGGNFHGQPVAMAADTLALAIAEVGALSERRIALLTDAHMSQLPPFLVEDSGLNCGFMAVQVAAAALASENKALAHPVSVDSLPTSANQEDHVSMSTYAARRLADMADNATGIVAIELLAGAQGIELRRPLRTTPALQDVVAAVRKRVPFYQEDRFSAPDIGAIKDLVAGGHFRALMPEGLLPSGGGKEAT